MPKRSKRKQTEPIKQAQTEEEASTTEDEIVELPVPAPVVVKEKPKETPVPVLAERGTRVKLSGGTVRIDY